jgi:deoxyribose-phosphate aldolase
MNLAPFIDHTVLKNTTTASDISALCHEAVQYGFAAVCIPPYFVQDAKKAVAGTTVKVATVIGFPFGYHHYKAKLHEAELAVTDGADELDMVMNIAAFKSNDTAYVEAEIEAISNLSCLTKTILKVIIESGSLTDEEIVRCCDIYSHFPIQFLKTSTGFAEKSASVHAVQLMRKHLPVHIHIKASGGIKTYAFAKELIEAGATRLGCSASVPIINGKAPEASY